MKKNDQLIASPRTRARLGLAGVVATGALALGLSFGGFAALPAYADEAAAPADASITAQIDGDLTLAERIAAEVLPSVGSVYCMIDNGYQQGISQGSCEVLNTDGYILTNYHVVEGSSKIQVVLNGDAYDATLVGSDRHERRVGAQDRAWRDPACPHQDRRLLAGPRGSVGHDARHPVR